jgi:hypothetical protein
VNFVRSRKSEESLPMTRDLELGDGASQVPSGSAIASLQAKPRDDDALAEDLIHRVMCAIREWTQANKLEHLPEEIAFEQALSILNSMYHIHCSQGVRRRRWQ